MKYILRPYQEEAVKAITDSYVQRPGKNDILVAATAAGKSLILANAAFLLNVPTLILCPSKEIVEQNYAKLTSYFPDESIGVYSASVGRKDISHITVATIQSIYKKPELFKHIKLILIDECDGVPLTKKKSMYNTFITKVNPISPPKIVGVTGTPYRMETTTTRKFNPNRFHATTRLQMLTNYSFWDSIIYNISLRTLTDQKFLTPITYYSAPVVKHDELTLNSTKNDFTPASIKRAFHKPESTLHVLEGLEWGVKNHKSVLVFVATLEQAREFTQVVPNSAVVEGTMAKKDREATLKAFQEGDIKVLFNFNTLVVGYDYPALDCVYLLRPTRSVRILVQAIGRGVRLHPDKETLTVVDFASNIASIGKIEAIDIVQTSPTKWNLNSDKGYLDGKELYSITGDF